MVIPSRPQTFRSESNLPSMGGECMALRHFQESNIIHQHSKELPHPPYPSVGNVKTPTVFLQPIERLELKPYNMIHI